MVLSSCYVNMQNVAKNQWAEEKYWSTIWSPVRNDKISWPWSMCASYWKFESIIQRRNKEGNGWPIELVKLTLIKSFQKNVDYYC